MGTIGRRVRAALLVTAIAATAAVGVDSGATPASAQAGPYAVTVTPSSGVGDGDVVEVTTTGLNGPYFFTILQCDASALDDPPSTFPGPCIIRSFQRGDGTQDTAQIVLDGAFVPINGDTVRCGREPGDCAIVSRSPDGWQAGTAIDMGPSPAVPSPRSQEVGFPVDAIVTAPPATTGAQLAQCVLPVGPDLASSQCSPTQPVALDGDGLATVPVTVVASVGAPAHPCGDGDCGLALFDGAGTSLGDGSSLTVVPADGPPQMSSSDLVGVRDGSFVNVTVTGILNESVGVAQCDASVAATQDVTGGPCSVAMHWEGDSSTGRTSLNLLLRRAFTGRDGTAVACETDSDCVVALKGSSGAFSTLPIAWDVPDTLSLSPADGLVDGDEITVTASDLRPNGSYRVARCAPDSVSEGYLNRYACTDDIRYNPSVTASAGGTLTTTIGAAQRFTTVAGNDIYCRDDCLVVLADDTGEVTAQPYGMSPGQLDTAPNSGLVDGQPVEVTWSATQPSYDGPLWWILQTGAWAVGQCGAGILDDTSVANVFRQCTVPPGGGAVTITEPDGGTQIEAQATIQPPIGGPIDCTATPEACVAVLVRVEQDASVTRLSSPLSFA